MGLSAASAQSLWLEGGLAYDEIPSEATAEFASGFEIGLRAIAPLTRRVGIYARPFWFGGAGEAAGLGVDGGVWLSLPNDPEDLVGFSSYLGAGLTLVRAKYGFALSGALSYELSRDREVVLIYTHRPVVSPEFSQTFDIALALKFDFD